MVAAADTKFEVFDAARALPSQRPPFVGSSTGAGIGGSTTSGGGGAGDGDGGSSFDLSPELVGGDFSILTPGGNDHYYLGEDTPGLPEVDPMTNVSWCGWVLPQSTFSGQLDWCGEWYNSGNLGWRLFSIDTQLRFIIDGGAGGEGVKWAGFSIPINTTQWHFIAISWISGTSVQIWWSLNKGALMTETIALTGTTSADAFDREVYRIGAQGIFNVPDLSAYWSRCGYWKAYNLTSADVIEIHRGGAGSTFAGLPVAAKAACVNYVHCEDVSGGAVDASFHGADLGEALNGGSLPLVYRQPGPNA